MARMHCIDDVVELLLEFFPGFVEGLDGFGVRIGDACHAIDFFVDDFPRNSYDGAVARDVLHHDGPGPDEHVISDRNVAEDFGSGSDQHSAPKRRMPLSVFLASSSESYALVNGTVVAYDSCFSDYDP